MSSDFTLTPDFTFDESPQFSTLISQFENGYEQRRAKWSAPLRKFHLVYQNRSRTDMELVKAFFIAKMGKYDSFTWTNPNDSVEYTVRFDADQLKFSNPIYGLFDFEFDFIEVR